MKKLLVVAALTMAAAPAMASKARVGALANSRQLVDVQYTFERPYLLHSVGELVTVEWGKSGDALATPHAEGGFVKKSGDSVYGAYFGRKSTDFSGAVALGNAATAAGHFLEEQNALNVLYGMKSGDLSWGATLKYSNGKNDDNKQKVTSMGVAAGLTNGTWEAELLLGLSGKTENDQDVLESKGNTKLGFGYNFSDSMHAYADYKMVKFDATIGGNPTQTTERTIMNVGFINTVAKNDDANVFYGIAYSMDTVKDSSETTTLPVWVGIEANATSWAVIRGSIKQNVLLNSVKDKTSGATSGNVEDLDSVVAAAGVGIKLNKGILDATFTQAGTGQINSDNLFSNVSYTYNF